MKIDIVFVGNRVFLGWASDRFLTAGFVNLAGKSVSCYWLEENISVAFHSLFGCCVYSPFGFIYE